MVVGSNLRTEYMWQWFVHLYLILAFPNYHRVTHSDYRIVVRRSWDAPLGPNADFCSLKLKSREDRPIVVIIVKSGLGKGKHDTAARETQLDEDLHSRCPPASWFLSGVRPH